MSLKHLITNAEISFTSVFLCLIVIKSTWNLSLFCITCLEGIVNLIKLITIKLDL